MSSLALRQRCALAALCCLFALLAVPLDASAQLALEPSDPAATPPDSAELALAALGDRLIQAARRGDLPALSAALDDGAPVTAVDTVGASALHHAAASARLEVVERLLAAQAPVAATASDGTTPLHWAARASGGATGREVAGALLAAGAAIGAADGDGRTPLHAAAYEGDPPLVELLLDRGAAIDAPDARGETPLHLAVAGGIRLDRFARSYHGGETASAGQRAVVELLLSRGADVDARADGEVTSLHRAARNGHRAFVQILLAGGADPAARTATGSTPRDLALLDGQEELAELLVAE